MFNSLREMALSILIWPHFAHKLVEHMKGVIHAQPFIQFSMDLSF